MTEFSIQYVETEVNGYGVLLTFRVTGPVNVETQAVLKMRPASGGLKASHRRLEDYRRAVHLAVALDALVMPCWINRTFQMYDELFFGARPPMVWPGRRTGEGWEDRWSDDAADFIEGVGAETWSDKLGAQIAFWWQEGFSVRAHTSCGTCSTMIKEAAMGIARDVGIPYKRVRFLTQNQAPPPDAAAFLGFELLSGADIPDLEETLH